MHDALDAILGDTDFDRELIMRLMPVLQRAYRAGQFDEMMGLTVAHDDPFDRQGATYIPFRDTEIENRLWLAGLRLRFNGHAGFYVHNADAHPKG